jgi:HK97 family phage major capsid protein
MSVVVTGNAKSKQALEKHGLEVKRVEDVERAGAVSSDELGGYLSPPEFGGVITAAMKAYGILPQFADPVPMGSDKTTFAKDSNDMEVVAVEEGEELPEKALNFEQLTLEAKLFGAYGVWSVSLDEDAVVNYGELWANRIARGMARKVDDCGFLGDGTKPFNKFVGLLNHADVTVVTMPAGKTGFGDIAYKDFINLFGSVAAEVRREGNCRVLVSSDLEYILADVKDGVGRPLFTEPTNGAVSRILGKDVTYADILPGLADEAPGTKFGIFGDLRRAIKLGTRSRLVIAYSPHARFRNAQNAIRALSRWGVKVAWPNAAAIIKTADA